MIDFKFTILQKCVICSIKLYIVWPAVFVNVILDIKPKCNWISKRYYSAITKILFVLDKENNSKILRLISSIKPLLTTYQEITCCGLNVVNCSL